MLHELNIITNNSNYMEFHDARMTSLVLKWAFVAERNGYETSAQWLTTIQQARFESLKEKCV